VEKSPPHGRGGKRQWQKINRMEKTVGNLTKKRPINRDTKGQGTTTEWEKRKNKRQRAWVALPQKDKIGGREQRGTKAGKANLCREIRKYGGGNPRTKGCGGMRKVSTKKEEKKNNWGDPVN